MKNDVIGIILQGKVEEGKEAMGRIQRRRVREKTELVRKTGTGAK
jgi:hypothetical protein